MKNLAVITGRLVALLSAVLLLANQGILSEMKSPIVKSATLLPSRASTSESEKARVRQAFANLPLCFVENRGQVDPSVAYYVQGNDRTIYFTSQGLTFSLTGNPNANPALDECLANSSEASHIAVAANQSSRRWTLKLDFIGANPRARLKAAEPSAASVNYFRGSRSQWQTGLKTYRSLVYENLWPGIDLLYAGAANQLKYTFIVKPGADANQIRLAYRGATGVKINDEGQLEVTTPVSSLSDERPISYQEISGRRVPVNTAYALEANTGSDSTYGFHVGEYDRSLPLVIDPAVFVYSGYLGGTNNDPAFKIAIDAAGNAYVTGMTSSQVTFPKTVGPDLSYNGNFFDAFVAKLNTAGTALVYCGYIGGAGNDIGFSIAVDAAGNAYVTGSTTSPPSSFPVTGGPGLVYRGGTFFGDAFVAKVRADGTGLLYCGYIGGSSDDVGLDIALDTSGNAYVTGQTASSESSFPVTVGPDLTFNGGSHDAFVAKVNPAGNALSYCGYIGGTDGDTGNGIAVDSAGNAYVAGSTASSETSFPVAVGPDLTYNGGGDGFVAKVNTAGTALLSCGYIGGSNTDQCSHIALDNAGNIYVTGFTLSDETSFPVAVGPDLTYNGGTQHGDAFIAKVSANGTGLIYCGYIGGSGEEMGADIAVDSGGNAYITGPTTSTEASFPIKGGANATYQGGSAWGDAFVAKVNAAGSLTFATYVGGSGEDGGTGIAVDQFGYAYITGGTESSQATFPIAGGPDPTYNSGQDSFVAKLVVITLSTQSESFTASGGAGSISLETPSNYGWTAASNDGFIIITSGSSGTGNGTVNYSVAVNTSSARQGTMTVAGQTVTVLQEACSAAAVSSQPTSQTACAGAAASFTVTATGTNPTYQWRKGGTNLANGGNISGATSATLTINPTGTGDDGSYDVVITGACGNATSNSATLTVNSYSLSAMSQGFPASGGASSVNVIVAGSCPWTAVSNDSWITVTSGTPGSGNGTVNYSVASNLGSTRSGTMTIAGITFTVNQSSPTLARLISFTATGYDRGTYIEWQTGFEVDNLGFRLWRDEAGERAQVNSQLIAGSALTAGANLRAGQSYHWWDQTNHSAASYWLEDIDLKGYSTWHGPFYVEKAQDSKKTTENRSLLLNEVGTINPTNASSVAVERTATITAKTQMAWLEQVTLAGTKALKLAVKQAGCYRLTQAELATAGFDTKVDPRLLQLFVDGREVPMLVSANKDGQFDASSFLEFYGLGIDTPSTDTRTYWLIQGDRAGKRITQTKGEGVSSSSRSFKQTVERRDRTTYFAALRNGEAENFFGTVVASQPINQTLNVTHLVAQTPMPAILEVGIQGVTLEPHRVLVQLNGVDAGYVDFSGQQQGTGKFSLPHSLLWEGANTVRLLSQNGTSDVSLIDHLRLSYQHTFIADDDSLSIPGIGNQRLMIDGFTLKAIRVFDVTDANNPQELLGDISASKNGFQITVTPTQSGERILLAVTDERLKKPVRLALNEVSNWRSQSNAADFVILSPRAFFSALEPLKALRESQGLRIALVDLEDIYDEFNFGTKSVQAVRDFFSYARNNWKHAPRYALLVGDASYDPKNYLGLGDNDLLPTKLLDTDYLETASDDWLADFNNDGIADLAIGRLPVRTFQQAVNLVQKIINYERAQPSESVLLVADRNEGFDFEQFNRQLRALLPANVKITEINRGAASDEQTKREILAALNRGTKLVNYAGHGSVSNWNGNLLTVADASTLTNREQLSFFVMMNCLNGYFQEAANDSLAEALLQAEGGAIAVWASSGLTMPQEQVAVNQALYRSLFDGKAGAVTLGEAVSKAKAITNNPDIRRTWTLLGDPTTRLK